MDKNNLAAAGMGVGKMDLLCDFYEWLGLGWFSFTVLFGCYLLGEGVERLGAWWRRASGQCGPAHVVLAPARWARGRRLARRGIAKRAYARGRRGQLAG